MLKSNPGKDDVPVKCSTANFIHFGKWVKIQCKRKDEDGAKSCEKAKAELARMQEDCGYKRKA